MNLLFRTTLKTEIKAVIIVAAALALGYIAKVTQAGQGIQEFLGGIGKGIGELLSPQIVPTFAPRIEIVPKIGLELCIPFISPCTVSSRDTGALPGGGSASAGFKPIPLANNIAFVEDYTKWPLGATGWYTVGEQKYWSF